MSLHEFMRVAEDSDAYEIRLQIGEKRIVCRIDGKLWHSMRKQPPAMVANAILHAINDGLQGAGAGKIFHLV